MSMVATEKNSFNSSHSTSL